VNRATSSQPASTPARHRRAEYANVPTVSVVKNVDEFSRIAPNVALVGRP